MVRFGDGVNMWWELRPQYLQLETCRIQEFHNGQLWHFCAFCLGEKRKNMAVPSCLQLTFHHNPACRTNPDLSKEKFRSWDPDTTLQCDVSALWDSSKHTDGFLLLRCDKKIGFAWDYKAWLYRSVLFFAHIDQKHEREWKFGWTNQLIRVE